MCCAFSQAHDENDTMKSKIKVLFVIITVASLVVTVLTLYRFHTQLRLLTLKLSGQNPPPPHIVFIVADDLGWSDVSWHNPNIITPNLEKLARSGLILNYSYVAPRCSPTRASLLTGYYPHRIGLQYQVINYGDRSLPLTFDLLPRKLKDLGYATHMVGKWHLGLCSWKHTPTYRGFDSFFGYYSGREDYYTHCIGNKYDLNFNTDVFNDTKQQYSTFLFRDRAVEIINEHDPSVPLFLYLPFQAVHGSLTVPREYSKMYSHLHHDRATYSGMVTAMDKAIGDVVNALEQRGLSDNMLLVFLSDNGGRPIKGGYNWPLRGIKNTLWEGGTRAVNFVYSKTLLKETSSVSNHLMNAADWFPTFLAAAGSKDVDLDMDGVNQWDVISKGAKPVRSEHVYNIEGRAAIRVGEYKLIKGDPGFQLSEHQPVFDFIGRARKMANGWIAPQDIGTLKTKFGKPISKKYGLFNLHKDPLEEHDISEDFPDIVEQLIGRLHHHMNISVPFVKSTPMSSEYSQLKIMTPGWCDK
ncbi:arylsulfatase B-like [Haliotis cracherodii]|uniref:arylsulfatase B-like n=1 Tax=Haliotis cracherodii TaxID=6455 RepID=UPI0039E74A4B